MSVTVINPTDESLPVVDLPDSAFEALAASPDDGVPILKATFVDASVPLSSGALPPETWEAESDVFGKHQIIRPPISPDQAMYLVENCPALRPLIDAICVTVDGLGHRAKPKIKLESKESDLLVRQILREELGREPRPSQIKKRKEQIGEEMWLEQRKFDNFFSNVTDVPLEEWRMNRRFDEETTGNGYFELLRKKPEKGDLFGEPLEWVLLPSFTVRMTRQDPEETTTECLYVDQFFRVQKRKKRRHFCRYVQAYADKVVYYKELGDPRIVSRKDGTVFRNLDELYLRDKDDRPATEIVHHKVFTARSRYGIPRFSGDIRSAYTIIDAHTVNNRFLTNNSVPPLALIVSGGRLSANTVQRLEKFIKERVAGIKSFGTMLVLEADGGISSGRIESSERFAQNGRMKIELKPLSEAVTKEGMFMNLIQQSTEQIARTFRMPGVVLGKGGANKQSDQFQLQMVDSLVAAPMRKCWDQWVNKFILPELGIRYYEYESKGPVNRDPSEIAEWLRTMSNGGLLRVAEGREKAAELLDINLPDNGDEFLKHPPLVYLKLLDQETAKMSREGTPERGTPANADKEVDTQYAESGGETKSKISGE